MVLGLLIAQFALPRRFAFLPLLIAICHFQNIPVIEVGGAFSTAKLVIVAGLFRASRERRLVWNARQRLDLLVAAWGVWQILSGFAHHPKDYNPLTIRLSLVFDFVGAYLYARAFLANRDDFARFAKCLAMVMLPLALLVLVERTTLRNFYGVLGGGDEVAAVRNGRVRAAGPFGHPILCGTFAAAALIILVSLRRQNPRWFFAGVGASVLVVFGSASSGPLMTLFSGLSALALWRFRTSIGWIRRMAITGIVCLHIIMPWPVWYLMARVDLAGGSTGWHRAELITASITYLDEWWLIGTEITRHWMPYGIEWSEDKTDITNHYLAMGVNGGLLLMFLFIAILVRIFQMLGRHIRILRNAKNPDEFTLWCVGATMFAHTFTFISVSYFDQNAVMLSLLFGAVPGLCAVARKIPAKPVAGVEPAAAQPEKNSPAARS